MILDKIVAHKRLEVARRREEEPIPVLMQEIGRLAAPRSLSSALTAGGGINIIAEIKRASPSAGMIAGNIDPSSVAMEYEMGGAAAISVLTDREFFAGDIAFLPQVRRTVSLPVLRKDFLIDPYQVYEARAYGADAILLIAAILGNRELKSFLDLTHGLGMEALVEVHDEHELHRVLETGAGVIGINNRNLKDFTVSLEATFNLCRKIPAGKIIVSESGIKTRSDIVRLEEAGIQAVLIGETLMRAPDRTKAIMELLGKSDQDKGVWYH
ncbi:MAG: indole-3-glycerol phosphate synthase TrpC [Desulfovibrionales bacterium]|nr:indole-3-glycerol phosphate synthase TrpC [Desulfovibrionales bacterium]